MYTLQQLAELSTGEIRENFFGLIDDIVTTYGDDRTLPVVYPGSQEGEVSLPGQDEQSVQVLGPVS